MTAADRIYLENVVKEEQGRLLGFIRKRYAIVYLREQLADLYKQIKTG